MKVTLFALLFALFACSVTAYVSNFEYFAMGELRASYVTPGTGSNNRGRYLFRYEAKSRTLNFHVISTLTSVGAVTINGPISCYNKANGGNFNQDSVECASNTGDVIAKLGKGVVPVEGETLGFQLFKGATVLNSVQEAMLFRNELNVQINSVTTSATTGKDVEAPAVRGQIYMYDFSNQNMVGYMVFENNRGDFDRDKSKTTNAGFGFVSITPNTNNNNNKQLNLVIYSSIQQPGNYVLKCPTGSKTLTQDSNPVETTITFDDDQVPLLLDLFLGECYIFITSAEATNGDLYSYIYPAAHMAALSLGANQKSPIPSPYLAYSMANFDASYKTLDIITKHNITDTITGAQIETFDGTVLCDITSGGNIPIRSFCRLNTTYLDTLQEEKIYLNIKTEANPNGEVRGPFAFNSRSSTSLIRSSSSSSSTAIGLGVGLGVGIPLFLLAIVGIVFLVKKGGDGKF